MNIKFKNFYHKYIKGDKRCPLCNSWMKNTGIDCIMPWKDEYYCGYCGKYYYI